MLNVKGTILTKTNFSFLVLVNTDAVLIFFNTPNVFLDIKNRL